VRGRTAATGMATLALLTCAVVAAGAEGRVVEQEKPYVIEGNSGIELYRSIGERGPRLGVARAIAHTNFKLTWSRKYEPQGNACTLVSARPNLVITYTLPKPAKPLSGDAAARWKIFIDGIRKHEKVHGEMIREMVARIEKTTIGMSAPDDPKCVKIRKAILVPLSEASLAQRQQSRDFDRVEMSEGGNMHRLILGLVNGQ